LSSFFYTHICQKNFQMPCCPTNSANPISVFDGNLTAFLCKPKLRTRRKLCTLAEFKLRTLAKISRVGEIKKAQARGWGGVGGHQAGRQATVRRAAGGQRSGHAVIRSYGHHIIRSYGHHIIRSYGHQVIRRSWFRRSW
jgi:hypothetical protein